MLTRKHFDNYLLRKILPRSIQYLHEPSVNQLYKSFVTSTRKIKLLYSEATKKNSESKVVILAHPYLAQAKLYFHHSGHVQYYKDSGFSIIFFDFNGFGESPFSDFYFEKDIEEVVHWAETFLQSNHLILHGISFGASQIIKYGRNIIRPGTLCIIENCLDKGIHYFLKRNIAIYIFLKFMYTILPNQRRKDDFTYGISLCVGFKGAAFIYGRDDLLTTPKMGEKIIKNCPVSYDSIILPGKHLEGIRQIPDYQVFLNWFFNKYINKTQTRI